MSKTKRQTKSGRRGRQAKMPTTQLGTFIQDRINALGLTRVELAHRLHVSPSTIGRLLNSDTRVVQGVSCESICEVLDLDEMQRRVFFELAKKASATTFAFATGASLPKEPTNKIDFDLADNYAEALQMLLNKGEAEYVMKASQRWYNQLTQEYPETKDPLIAATQIRFGLLLGSAQIYVVPWYQRADTAIRTFNQVEEDIICRFDLNTFKHEHAQLIGHRAPLYREIKHFEESAKQFEDGLFYLRGIDDPLLHASLLRNHAHIRAILGDELCWAREIEAAINEARRMRSPDSEDFVRIALNMQAEGYRRLAFSFHKDLSIQTRRKLANLALDAFSQTREVSERLGFRYQHIARRLVVHVSEMQCLIWIDPYEAIRRAEQLKALAFLYYPTILDKINRVVYLAKQRLQASRSDLPMFFNLDARPGESLIWH